MALSCSRIAPHPTGLPEPARDVQRPVDVAEFDRGVLHDRSHPRNIFDGIMNPDMPAACLFERERLARRHRSRGNAGGCLGGHSRDHRVVAVSQRPGGSLGSKASQHELVEPGCERRRIFRQFAVEDLRLLQQQEATDPLAASLAPAIAATSGCFRLISRIGLSPRPSCWRAAAPARGRAPRRRRRGRTRLTSAAARHGRRRRARRAPP